MLILVLIAIFAYALFLVAISRASIFTDSNLVASIVNALGTFVPLGLFYLSGAKLANSDDQRGIFWAIIGGVGVAVYIIAFARIFSIGGNIGFVTPLVYGGAIVVATFVGWLFYQEQIDNWQFIGLSLVTFGIGCITYSRFLHGLEKL